MKCCVNPELEVKTNAVLLGLRFGIADTAQRQLVHNRIDTILSELQGCHFGANPHSKRSQWRLARRREYNLRTFQRLLRGSWRSDLTICLGLRHTTHRY